MSNAIKKDPVLSDSEIANAFAGTNFGHTEFRDLLNASVLKKAMGYHCGSTITAIMHRLGLISLRAGKPLKRGEALLREAYSELTRDAG